jgi:hypothetical protein
MVVKRKDARLQGAGTNPTSPVQQNINIQGLHTYPNQFSVVPQGALSVASNCVIDAQGVVESRRGINQYGTFNTPTIETLTINEYISTLVTHTSNNKISLDLADDGNFIAKDGTYAVPDPTNVESRVRFANLNRNLYFTTSGGVFKLDSITAQPRRSGAPPALGGNGVVTGVGWMPLNVNVAYRITWSYIDANNNLIRSAPSDRIIVPNNVSNGMNVQLTFVIPSWIATDTQQWTYNVYRGNVSSSLATSPDDNMQLVYTGVPAGAQLASRVVTIIDSAPDTTKGELLYTSAEGIAQANFPPPFSNDIALFKGHTFYSNTSLTQTFFLTLISGSNMVNGNTLTFTLQGGPSFTLTAGAAESVATGTFLNKTNGTPSENISITAQSIVNVLNLYASNTFLNGYYTSSFEETPGRMVFRAREFNIPTFSVTSSNTGLLWNPRLPASGTTIDNTSTSSTQQNAIYYSKLQQPEAVPLGNFYLVGSGSSPIMRILALQDTLFILKTEGLFKLTGNSVSNFTVSPIDVQMRPVSINSAVVLNNQVYVFVDQGVVRISDSSAVELISTPIQQDLLRLATPNYPGFRGATYGVSYPPEHKYFLFTVDDIADEISTIAYVFNYITDAWTTWDLQLSAAFMKSQNELLYFGTENNIQSQIYVERKSFTIEDYTDLDFPVEIESITPNPTIPGLLDIVITAATFGNVDMNQTLQQSAAGFVIQGVIETVNLATRVIHLDNNSLDWIVGPATVYNPINNQITMTPIIGNTPNAMKQFTELSLLVDSTGSTNLYVAYTNDVNPVPTLAYVVNDEGRFLGWGNSPWSNFAWGEAGGGQIRVRTFIPRDVCKGDWIQPSVSARNAFNRMRISGVSVYFRPLSPRIR